MGRIKKAAGTKHEASLSTSLSQFIEKGKTVQLAKLPALLASFPPKWPFPRGDLYHWIPLLDKFDSILEVFIDEYGLKDGPQTQPFGVKLLQRGLAPTSDDASTGGFSPAELEELGYGPEGDRELVEVILKFSRMLLETCGNRSLYSSSDRIDNLLNTTSLSLLSVALHLATRLAMRYHHSRQRNPSGHQHINSAFLLSHYNINLDHVQKLADVFIKTGPLVPADLLKGKERGSTESEERPRPIVYGSDIVAAVKDMKSSSDEPTQDFKQWGNVSFTYYQPPPVVENANRQSAPSTPTTPTPARRSSGLSRPSRLASSDEPTSPIATKVEEHPASSGLKKAYIPYSKISSNSIESILEGKLPELPKEVHYELLAKLRVAKALSHSLETRKQIIAIRILALTNLAYIYPETIFQQKFLQLDSDEPKRLQIVYQLAELVSPLGSGKASIPLELRTIALGALEALTKHKSRVNDVCAALGVNIGHGILLYTLRKAVSDIASDNPADDSSEADEWRDALFSLVEALPSAGNRTTESLVGAGLFEILVELLKLRNAKAERNHYKVLTFMNAITHSVRDAFQSFANNKGLDVIADLIAWEVTSSIEAVQKGNGLSDQFRSPVMDYQMPFFQQQTLRWVFKFVNHMMQHGNQNIDRLLRNLIDSPQLLNGLRDVISNGRIFGSNIWSSAVSIMSNFIHNEPTSYAVISEAGLSKGLLEAISQRTIDTTENLDTEPNQTTSISKSDSDSIVKVSTWSGGGSKPVKVEEIDISRPAGALLAQGILPATDAILTVPQAFTAICLNTAGLELFLKSGAFETFFEIFESPDHVKSMSAEADLPKVLGNSFDELVRHHPRVKAPIMRALVIMVARVNLLCKRLATESGEGAKLFDDAIGDTQSVEDEMEGTSVTPMSSESDSRSSNIKEVEKSKSTLTATNFLGVVTKFLSGFFDNQSLCSIFVYEGGLDFFLDLASSPSLPHDFNSTLESQELSRVMHMLVEHKPHLVLPSLVIRTLDILKGLEPFIDHEVDVPFFAESMAASKSKGKAKVQVSASDAARVVKGLVRINTFCNILNETFAHPLYSSRSNYTLFTAFNFADHYVILVKALGKLQRACIWEDTFLQSALPGYAQATLSKQIGLLRPTRSPSDTEMVNALIPNGNPTTGISDSETNSVTQESSHDVPSKSSDRPRGATDVKPKNAKYIRFLLIGVATAITPFFQGLGRALVPKRKLDSYPRQNSYIVANAMAEVLVDQLDFVNKRAGIGTMERYSYWTTILNLVSQLMIEGIVERSHSHCLILPLLAFKNQGGLYKINNILQIFNDEILSDTTSAEIFARPSGRAFAGMKIILDFYASITSSKNILDSSQNQSISLVDRDRDHAYFYSPAQFIVELRLEVLSVVRSLWESNLVEKALSPILKSLIDILRTVLEGDRENGAFKRGEALPYRKEPELRVYTINVDKEKVLMNHKDIPADLAKEALYRCMNNRDSAPEEYCDVHIRCLNIPRVGIPPYDREKKKPLPPSPAPPTSRETSDETIPEDDISGMDDSSEQLPEQPPAADVGSQTEAEDVVPDERRSPPLAPSTWTAEVTADEGNNMAMSIDNILNISEPAPSTTAPAPVTEEEPIQKPMIIPNSVQKEKPITVDDLEALRAETRKALIDRVLDILSEHGDMTFELSDLVITAASKGPDNASMRKEVGETLIQSLISFQLEDDFRPAGRKVASYASLLAIIIQEKDFYDAALDELKSNFSQLLGFIKVFPDQPPEEPSPWVGQILLIIEKILAEDVQPEQIRWTPQSSSDDSTQDSIAQIDEPLIPLDEKMALFDAIMDLLPRVNKDHSLALSVVRVFVILTRSRDIANKLGDKRNLQRLFTMVKQLVSQTSEKFQSAFMLVLRHIIEDDETIRRVMRSEILSSFTSFNHRAPRPVDTVSYVRNMHALVLRSPKLFLETTNEKLKLERFDHDQRPQALVLKDNAVPSFDDTAPTTELPKQDQPIADIHPSTEEPSTTTSTDEKGKVVPIEAKAPTVEHPDGVIHYLLSQLLTYKEVDDADPEAKPKEPENPRTSPTPGDVDMGVELPTRLSIPSSDQTESSKKPDKPEYKSEDHPIYLYRCFLLQTLTELLMSYTRAKIEFINFSHRRDPKLTTTPSKPRSTVLNYLLSGLIPTGSIERGDTIVSKKKLGTSNWAMCALVGLCVKTTEDYPIDKRDMAAESPDSDLLFVRRFVLEHALKAFKDTHASSDPLDTKYARLLSLADLFGRLLQGRVFPSSQAYTSEAAGSVTGKEVARIMFEKNFISALTSSIADIDLNFPNAKRVIKYILRPLKILTQSAITLSESAEISASPGQTDDDEISTASSATDPDDHREETPDLFRNSTLGILEAGGEDDSSTESDDEDQDMYDDEYEEGMDYEGEMPDGDEVVSDEDEELEDAGPIEGLPGDVGMDLEVVIDGDDDEDDDDDSEDDSDDEMDEDDQEAYLDDMDEITADDENDSMGEGHNNDWQDEDNDDDEIYPEEDEADMDHSSEGQEHHNLHHHTHHLPTVGELLDMPTAGGAAQVGEFADLEMDIGTGRYMTDLIRDADLIHDEEDMDEDEDDDEAEDDEVMYEPEYEDEDGIQEPPAWGWEGDDEPGPPGRGHHHPGAHVRRINTPWSLFSSGNADRNMIGNEILSLAQTIIQHNQNLQNSLTRSVPPSYRSHRPTGGPRGADDGVNPLLQRSGATAPPRRVVGPILQEMAGGFPEWVQMVHSRHRHSADIGAMSIINNILQSTMGATGDRLRSGPLHLAIDESNPTLLPFSQDLQQLLTRRPPGMDPPRAHREDSSFVPFFYPTQTQARWQEESRLLFGSAYVDKAARVLNSLLKILVPPALEEEKKRKEAAAKAEEAARLKREEEVKVKAEEERLAKEKAEKEAQEQKEKEEREAAERAAAELASQEQEAIEGNAENEVPDEDAMEGVEATTTEPALPPAEDSSGAAEVSTEAGPSAQTQRVRATFRGREVDITGLGIDLEYLNALPDELREEVLMNQLSEQRSQAAVAGEEPTEINREFLDALPPDIREEILQQEARERRQREREEQRAQAIANGTAPPPRVEEMDTASFFASLDPVLRNAVLLEQDEDMLAQLPAAIAAEARALGAERIPQGWRGMPRANQGNDQRINRNGRSDQVVKKPPRRQIVQMLDKTGVATLLRLLFISQQGGSRESLNAILQNVCENRNNRAEVLGLLLSILVDGSADVQAIERSFTHLSLRAKQPSTQKTPQSLKRVSTGSFSTPLSSEMTPLMVIQQCLSALVHLTEINPHVPSFFLAEHDTSPLLKNKSSKKGKAKETRASRFPLNALLTILDRKLIMESAGCMEQLSNLLQSITAPLIILRKEKDRPLEPAANAEASATGANTENPITTDDATQPESNEGTQVTDSPSQNEPNENTEMTDISPPPVQEPDPASDSTGEPTVEVPGNDPIQEPEQGAKAKASNPAKTDEAPKKRNLVPPEVPEENLRLVINIIAARECTSNVFRGTLTTINNLSSLPGAKDVFGKELIRQAQDLGDIISRDIDDLITQIQRAETNTDVQGAALAKFSAPSSDQAKLLRVLTALDWIFDPKNNKSTSQSQVEEAADEDLLATLFENSTFGPLWTKLSTCLSSIRQHEGMFNVATILLPLVEALMVVCKSSTLKEATSARAAKEFIVTSPAPESIVENLFFRFTEEHRKVLNDLVRNNPRLMSGTFAILVKNPKVLEFDNKRNYFTRRLHARTESRVPQPPLQLSVRRENVFLDSFKSLYFKSPEEMKFGKLSIRFHNEEGVDAGGVTREWFQVMSRQMFNPDYALFVPVASDRTTFHPNRLSSVNAEHLTFFKFIGRIIGKAVYEGRALDCHFSRAVYKRILSRPVSIKDMETLDLDYYKSLVWMLDHDIGNFMTETFSIETDAFGVQETVDLVPNGRNIPLTNDNKEEYIQLVVEHRLTGSVKEQLAEFLRGFHDIVPAELVSIFNEQELELLISGLPDIDIDDWKANTEYHNYSASSPQIQWFWRAVRSFEKEERAKLLQFVTGTSKVPLNGFKELEGMNGFSRFNIHRDYGNKDRLPSSHTCFNQIDLPEYESYEILRQRVYTAITAGSEYFGFA